MNKKRKRLVSILCIVLALLMVFSLVLSAIPVSAYAVSQGEIDALKAERDEIVKQREAQQAVVDDLSAQQADALEIKLALDERNEVCLRQIDLNNQVVAAYQEMILVKEQEVQDAKALEIQQLGRYRARVRAMEENGEYDFLALLLNTTDLGAFLTLIDDIGEIMDSDKHLEDQYIAARENTETVKAEYETYKAETEAIVADLENQSAELEVQIQEANEYLARIQSQLDDQNELLEKIEAAEAEADAQVSALIAELAAQKAAEAAAAAASEQTQSASSVVGTGAFLWPVPSCKYITSRMGYRIHPVSGEYKYHSGLDIGAQYGAAIVAADAGTVIMSEYYGGYGNCLIIDHGNGYQTLYGHMATFSVSEGQTVSAGQTVGTVGSTGVSTGPHLHFEIRENGTCIDPEQFYSGPFTYAADAGD